MHTPKRPSYPQMRILLVDDEEIVLNTTRDYLTSCFSFLVDTASDGTSALSMLAQNQYDAIVADYEMEEMSGIDLLLIIRGRGDDIPFIIFTGRGREEVVVTSFEQGADGYVQKGGETRSQFAELAQKISSVIQSKQTEKALYEQNKRHRILFETMGQGGVYQDGDGHIIEVNPAAEEILGLSYDQIIGRTSADPRWKAIREDMTPLPEDEHPSMIALRTGEEVRGTMGIYHPVRDEYRWIQIHATPLFQNGQKSPFQVYSIFSDITEKRKAQEQTALHAERLKILLDLNRMAEKSKEELLTYAIDACLKITKSRYSFIGFMNEDETELTIHACSELCTDMFPGFEQNKSYQVDLTSIWGDVIRMRKPLIMNQCTEFLQGKGGVSEGGVTFTKVLGVPAFDGEKIAGVVGVAGRHDPYEDGDSQALMAFGSELWTILKQKETLDTLYLKNYAIESAMNGIAVANLAGVLTYVNPAFLFIWKYKTKEEVIGKNAVSFWKEPEQAAGVIESLQSTGRWQGEMQAEQTDGTLAELLVNAHTIRDPSGSPIAIMASFMNITERKQAERDLHKANNLITGMLDGISDIVGLQLLDHTIIRYNKAGYSALGLSQSDVEGKKCYELIGRDSPCDVCATSLALETKKPETLQKFVPEFGRYLECTSNPILNSDGEPELVVELLHDITSQKEAEKALYGANQKLQLLSGITRHDILNSLGVLLLFLDSMPHEELSPEVKKNLERIEEYALKIQSQIEFTHDYQVLGLAQALWQNVSECFRRAEEQVRPETIKIETNISDLEVFADPMLVKVIFNLIDNALRYGGPDLTKIMSYYRKDGDGLIWVIEDDGAGVVQDMKEKIFHRGVGTNTGFGLFLSGEILSITGMAIRETGEEGHGARFEIVVPKGMFRIGHQTDQGGSFDE